MTVAIERLEAKEYLPAKDLIYVDVFKLHDYYKDMAYRANLILVGPKGIGKTLSVAAFAAKDDAHLVTYDCSEDVRRSNLLGMNLIRGGETPFVLGPLTTAFEIANETGKCILAMEEFNALTPQMQKVMNAAADFRRKIEVPECGRVFRLKEGAKLWIVGTMNTAVYGGVYALNEDLKSRFRMVDLPYPEPKLEREIVMAVVQGTAEAEINLVLTLAHETRQKALEYALSTRDVVQIVEDIAFMGKERALRVCLGKFEGDDKSTVAERITSIFGVKVK
jgi:nitric oxide reductase NorQ protein